MKHIETSVKEAIHAATLEPEIISSIHDIDNTHSLKLDVNMDSLSIMELVMELEVKFNIDIDDNQFNGDITVQDMINAVEELVL